MVYIEICIINIWMLCWFCIFLKLFCIFIVLLRKNYFVKVYFYVLIFKNIFKLFIEEKIVFIVLK